MNGKNHDRIWMKVTLDQFQLPVAVADSARELAELCGTTPENIYLQRSRHRNNMERCPWLCISC